MEISKKHRKSGVVLTVSEMQTLLDQPNLSLPMQIRDRAVMEILYAAAIRANELLTLTVHDVEPESKLLYIRKGKGSRDRVVPLSDNAASFLNEYLTAIDIS